jgi:hypothetical protein
LGIDTYRQDLEVRSVTVSLDVLGGAFRALRHDAEERRHVFYEALGRVIQLARTDS